MPCGQPPKILKPNRQQKALTDTAIGKGFHNMELLPEETTLNPLTTCFGECAILPEVLSNRYQKKDGNLVEPLKKPVYKQQKFIPTLQILLYGAVFPIL